jgi:transcriptional regulator
MYIPNTYKVTDKAKIVSFMRRFSFATVITSKKDFPIATHLPFIIKEEGDKLLLLSHFARQNEQWKDIEGGTVMVIFNEPHAYISPTNYEKELNVPTWNYVAVHAYGVGHIITQPEDVMALLESTIDNYEAGYREQWNRLPEKYKTGQAMGIVAFKVEVTDLQAKEKLSQNKTRYEQQRIIDNLSASDDTNERVTAEYMKENLQPK